MQIVLHISYFTDIVTISYPTSLNVVDVYSHCFLFVLVNVLREKKTGQSLETLDEMAVDEGENVGKKPNEETIGELGQLVLRNNVKIKL